MSYLLGSSLNLCLFMMSGLEDMPSYLLVSEANVSL